MNTQKTITKFISYGLLLTILLCAIGFGVGRLLETNLIWPLAAASTYSVLAVMLYGLCWKIFSKMSSSSLTLFYMAGLLLRMMLAMPFLLAIWKLSETYDEMLTYVIVFFIFYLAELIYNVVFFIGIEKQNNKINN